MHAPSGHGSPHGGPDRREPAEDDARPRSVQVADVAQQRTADGRAADQDDRLQRQDTPAHAAVRSQLHHRCRRGDEPHAREPDEQRQRVGERHARRRGEQQHRHAEHRRSGAHRADLHLAALCRGERAEQRPDAQHRVDRGIGPVGAAEGAFDQQRQDHREVERERADHGQHHERDPQVRCPSHIAEPLTDLPSCAVGDRRRAQLGRPHHPAGWRAPRGRTDRRR